MLFSIVIIASSAAMLLYWFRYSCVLLRNAYTSEADITRAVHANDLSIRSVVLAAQTTHDRSGLRTLHELLERDRRVVEFLLEQSGRLATVESIMLRADYLVMSGACRVARLVCPSIAPLAMREMAASLACLASALGRQIESRHGA
jgi:hypothetical protein